MASLEKKRRFDVDFDFSDYPKELTKSLVKALQKIITWGVPQLVPLKILNCNAADGNCGMSFSKAYCYTNDDSEQRFAFADIFERGLGILVTFIETKEFPKNTKEKFVLSKLLRYLQRVEQFPSEKFESLTETELTTLLANHLFGQLATCSQYIIDKNCTGTKRKGHCVCSNQDCSLTGSYGDTSIGHELVWHGKVDIIVNNELIVDAVEKNEDSPEGESPVEVKIKSTDLTRNSQIIAEAIVFSFLQKQRHPESDHFLFPCIGVGSSELIIMFYDSQYDILLESSPVPLMEPPVKEGSHPEISLSAVIICWLVVNYKYLCTGLSDFMKGYKADFISLVKDKIAVYEENLKLGNVGGSFVLEKVKSKINEPRTKSMQNMSRKMTDIYFSFNETSTN